MNIKQGELVADFACGTGLNIPLISKCTQKITAIDFSEEMLAVARKKHPGFNFLQGDACTSLLPEKADKIVCTYSLSLIENWKVCVKNMAGNLNASGSLVILDFHPWNGLAGIFYPVFKWWLKIHNVDPELPVEAELKKYFQKVEIRTYLSGYNFIAIAKEKFINPQNLSNEK